MLLNVQMEFTHGELLVVIGVLPAVRLQSSLMFGEHLGHLSVGLAILIQIETYSLQNVQENHEHIA